MTILLILFPNQLFETKYIDKIINYSDDNTSKNKYLIILWEHEYFFTKFKYHKMKLLFHRSTMQCYYDKLSKNYNIEYIENITKNPEKKIIDLIKKHKIDEIRVFNPIEKEIIELVNTGKLLNSYKIEYTNFPSVYFLNSIDFNINDQIQKNLSSIRHDVFYKLQRIKYDIMVKKNGDKVVPEGNKWSFDTENRSPFEKTQVEPPIIKFTSKSRKDYVSEGIIYINKNFSKHYGSCEYDNFIYPIDHEEAEEWLDNFVKNKLDKFGKFEDALSSKIKFGYHSLLSAILNIGLITTKQILKKISNYKKNIASKEGFIRQIIGWREYCYFVYDKYYDKLVLSTIYHKNKNKIPEKVWKGSTLIPIIDNIINNVNKYAYSHHIERLMGIGNFLLLIGVSADQIYLWFQTMYIDAYDVFMVPNVYGMLLYANTTDKNKMMTRPYFCSSNYLIKMSDYKSSEINFGNISYKWDDIIDALYYNFINKYSNELKKIYSSASAVSRWNSFDKNKKNQLLRLSKMYIEWVYK
jgi:deoxyribodipyrimidine photolyase-related protein